VTRVLNSNASFDGHNEKM